MNSPVPNANETVEEDSVSPLSVVTELISGCKKADKGALRIKLVRVSHKQAAPVPIKAGLVNHMHGGHQEKIKQFSRSLSSSISSLESSLALDDDDEESASIEESYGDGYQAMSCLLYFCERQLVVHEKKQAISNEQQSCAQHLSNNYPRPGPPSRWDSQDSQDSPPSSPQRQSDYSRRKSYDTLPLLPRRSYPEEEDSSSI
jgi:hypothetical protein